MSSATRMANASPNRASRQQSPARVAGALIPRAPFDFAQTLAFMRLFTPMAGEQRVTEGALTKAVALAGRAVVCHVWSEGTVEQPRLGYTLTSASPLSEGEVAALRQRVSAFLSLDDDLGPFYARAQTDPALAPIISRRYGLHQPTFLTPFEIACWAVLTQRMPMEVARQVKDRLVERFGVQLTLDGVVYRAFPEVATLSAAADSELAAIVRNERKVAYLRSVIQLFTTVEESWLRTAPLEQVMARLRATQGIGEWSMAFILVRGLGRVEYASAHDEALQRAAGRLYNAEQPLAVAALRVLLERYGDTRGYWAFYCRSAFANGDHRVQK